MEKYNAISAMEQWITRKTSKSDKESVKRAIGRELLQLRNLETLIEESELC